MFIADTQEQHDCSSLVCLGRCYSLHSPKNGKPYKPTTSSAPSGPMRVHIGWQRLEPAFPILLSPHRRGKHQGQGHEHRGEGHQPLEQLVEVQVEGQRELVGEGEAVDVSLRGGGGGESGDMFEGGSGKTVWTAQRCGHSPTRCAPWP